MHSLQKEKSQHKGTKVQSFSEKVMFWSFFLPFFDKKTFFVFFVPLCLCVNGFTVDAKKCVCYLMLIPTAHVRLIAEGQDKGCSRFADDL